MKHWPTLALIIGGLAFVLYFQLAPHFQASAPVSVAVNGQRPTPRKRAPSTQLRKEPTPMTFGGYPCPAGDCAKDKAGFKWAARNRIRDPDDCTGTSTAFIEGCRVYAERQALPYTPD